MCSWHPPNESVLFTPSLFTIDQLSVLQSFIMRDEIKELTPKQVLAFPCLTCGAKRRERCELSIEMPVQTRIGIDV